MHDLRLCAVGATAAVECDSRERARATRDVERREREAVCEIVRAEEDHDRVQRAVDSRQGMR